MNEEHSVEDEAKTLLRKVCLSALSEQAVSAETASRLRNSEIPSEIASRLREHRLPPIEVLRFELDADATASPWAVWSDKKQLKLVERTDFLFSDDKTIRLAAIDGLISMLEADQDVAAYSTLEQLKRQRTPLADKHPSRWLPAARCIADLLENDFLWNRCGLCASRELGNSEIGLPFARRVLYPGISMFDPASGTHVPPQLASTPREQLERDLRECDSFPDAFELFLHRFGHLPTAGPWSAASLAPPEHWSVSESDRERLWARFQSYSDDLGAVYHFTCLFAAHPDLLPESQRATGIGDILSIVNPVLTSESPFGEGSPPAWRAFDKLARHYTDWIILQSHGVRSDFAVEMGLWCARKVVMNALRRGSSVANLEEWLLPHTKNVNRLSTLVPTFFSPSPLFVVLRVHLWRLSLLPVLAATGLLDDENAETQITAGTPGRGHGETPYNFPTPESGGNLRFGFELPSRENDLVEQDGRLTANVADDSTTDAGHRIPADLVAPDSSRADQSEERVFVEAYLLRMVPEEQREEDVQNVLHALRERMHQDPSPEAVERFLSTVSLTGRWLVLRKAILRCLTDDVRERVQAWSETVRQHLSLDWGTPAVRSRLRRLLAELSSLLHLPRGG